jgi:hypothetical protein
LTQAGQRFTAQLGQVVVQGLVHRHGRLLGAGQAVEVIRHSGAGLAQLEVDLAAAAELAQEEEQADPQQEAAVVDQAVGVALVGEVIQPVVELGEEVADGADQGGADGQGRPRLRFLFWA